MLSTLHYRVYVAHDFDVKSGEWAELNRSLTGNHPFLDPRFVGPLVRHFGSSIRPEHLQLIFACDGDRPVAAMIVERVAPTIWQLFCPDQAQIAPAIIDRQWLCGDASQNLNKCGGEFLSELASHALGRTSVLRLTAQDPLVSPWPAVEPTNTFELRVQARTVSIDTMGGFEAYWRGRSKGLRSEMRRKLVQLAAGEMSPQMSVVSDPDCIARAVDGFARIESAGWKGLAGTAVMPGGLQNRFYREVLTNFAVDGGAAIYELNVGNRIVASQMTLRQAGMQVILKTTFDEEFRSYGVGRIADYLGYQLMFGDATTREIELYTNASDLERRWATSERTIVNVLWYRSNVARLGMRVARSAIAGLRRFKRQTQRSFR